jgi:nitroimidazol reductase NimA-like FMN-containing flavoprotein (pyridoxamine 5'-phosphate oxidase superfamily)/GNAT superfamily N-acetyltransferase
MEELRPTPRTIPHRYKQRASYQRETINAILDESLVCHLGFIADGAPFVLPTLHARIGGQVYVHGSSKNHMLRTAAAGGEICLTVTLLDALVLARSAFHHSVNYRSVVVIGRAREVNDETEKMVAMRALVEHVTPGRWEHTRQPHPNELAASMVLALPISEASAKVRSGGPLDDDADYSLPHWAGVIPLRTQALTPIPDARLSPGISMPHEVAEFRTPQELAGGVSHDGNAFEREVNGFVISTDVARIDVRAVHQFLHGSYWAEGVPREVVARSIASSLCFGVYSGDEQAGFARVVTDYASFAYVADVFVAEKYRGHGLGKALMAAIVSHPRLQGLRRWTLATRDAHGLYRQFGFVPPTYPDRQMERIDPRVYARNGTHAR